MPTRKWKTELLVNTTTAGSQNQSSVVALADGGFLVAWRDDGPADSVIRAQRFDATGVRVGSEFVINGLGGDQLNPVLVALNDGNVWALQQDFDSDNDHDAAGQVIQPDGTIVRNFQDPAGSGNDEVRPAAASLGENGAVAVWMNLDAQGGDIHMRGFNADGSERFAIATVNTNAGTLANIQYGPSVAGSPDGGKFVVVWGDQGETTGEVRARVFNANGTEAAAEFAVSSLNPEMAPDASTSVAWLDNNRFAVTWFSFAGDSSNAAIKYAIFHANGTSFTGERLANSTTIRGQEDPVIAALPSGGFVIAWMDFSRTGGDSSFSGIRLQAFDGAGDKIGGEILVNTVTAEGQFEVSLTALADGRVVVSWTDNSSSGGDTSGHAIRAQIIDPRDGIVDGTSNADTLYGHDAVGDDIRGFDGDDTIHGLAGNDTIQGGNGVDTINAGKGDDFVYGGLDADVILGEAGDDELYGEAGGDTLDGGVGDDSMAGGLDNDTYRVDSAGDTVVELAGQGTLDTVMSSVDYVLKAGVEVELLRTDLLAGTAAIDLTGNALKQTIMGNAGANILNDGGGAGADTLQGLGGDDTYRIGNSGAVIKEAAGQGTLDVVISSVDYVLKAGVDVEEMRTDLVAGTAAIDLTGNALKQTIIGNAGANILNDGGGAGIDTLQGLGGNDTYRVGNSAAIVKETAGQGTQDTLMSSVAYVLKAGVDVEVLRTDLLAGTGAIDLTGNEIAQAVIGNAGANVLDGKGGADKLTGLGGKDFFVFSSALGGGNIDTVADFSVVDDTIRLENAVFTKLTPTAALDSTLFRASSAGTAADANDFVLYDTDDGKLYYDADGSGGGGRFHFATLTGAPAVSAADFAVI